MYHKSIKRIIDFSASFIALLMLSPLFIILASLVAWDIGYPVVFLQLRPGLNSKPFSIYKFRTMSNVRDDTGQLLSDGLRLTKFGRFLRSTSLDELPELINVLKGEMSLVGPRPLLMHYLDLYTPYQARRHEVRPGITGWAQINGRNALSWEEKFKLDVWYVDNCSFLLDLKIILLTVFKVLRREGISQAGEATMPEFKGASISRISNKEP